MKIIYLILINLLTLLLFSSCAKNKKRKVWISPPPGHTDPVEENISYRVKTIDGEKEVRVPLSRLGKIQLKNDNDMLMDETTIGAAAPVRDRKYLNYIQNVENLYGKEDYYQALMIVGSAIDEFPNKVRFLTMQGTLYKKIGENKLALASYKKAYELEPNILYEEVIENLENEIEETLP